MLEAFDRVVTRPQRLLPCVESLNLSHNRISRIENLESLPRLSELDLSHNIIAELGPLHTKLGNMRCLLLAGNKIESLAGTLTCYFRCCCLLWRLPHAGMMHNRV